MLHEFWNHTSKKEKAGAVFSILWTVVWVLIVVFTFYQAWNKGIDLNSMTVGIIFSTVVTSAVTWFISRRKWKKEYKEEFVGFNEFRKAMKKAKTNEEKQQAYKDWEQARHNAMLVDAKFWLEQSTALLMSGDSKYLPDVLLAHKYAEKLLKEQGKDYILSPFKAAGIETTLETLASRQSELPAQWDRQAERIRECCKL